MLSCPLISVTDSLGGIGDLKAAISVVLAIILIVALVMTIGSTIIWVIA